MLNKGAIVGMGKALCDILPEGKKIGGASANFAYHVFQFGFDSYVVSAIGYDKLGDNRLNISYPLSLWAYRLPNQRKHIWK